jgi:hypothetical protein
MDDDRNNAMGCFLEMGTQTESEDELYMDEESEEELEL